MNVIGAADNGRAAGVWTVLLELIKCGLCERAKRSLRRHINLGKAFEVITVGICPYKNTVEIFINLYLDKGFSDWFGAFFI